MTTAASSAASIASTAPSAHVLDAIRRATIVCFDVDSTVCTEEGIDVLAQSLGDEKQAMIVEWTTRAMNGAVPFHEALRQRLDVLQPTRQQVQACIDAHPLVFTPRFVELVEVLRACGKDVYLVSGGFRQMIAPLQHALHLDDAHVFANRLLFRDGGDDDGGGAYAGYDENEPTAWAGGKARAIQTILGRVRAQAQGAGAPATTLVESIAIMIGDGATDLEARPPAAAFIGFGGVCVREKVQRGADWFVTRWDDVIDAVQQVCGVGEAVPKAASV